MILAGMLLQTSAVCGPGRFEPVVMVSSNTIAVFLFTGENFSCRYFEPKIIYTSCDRVAHLNYIYILLSVLCFPPAAFI